jgi:hypothetical protein
VPLLTKDDKSSEDQQTRNGKTKTEVA